MDLVLRWIHILSGIVLVGGTIYWRCAVLPASDVLSGSENDGFQTAMRARWSKLVMLTSGLLLLSGLTNAVLIITRYELSGSYHMLVGLKLVLALAIFWISAVLSGRSTLAGRFREKLAFWLNVNIVLAVVLVCLAGVMKMSDRTPKLADPVAAIQADSSVPRA